MKAVKFIYRDKRRQEGDDMKITASQIKNIWKHALLLPADGTSRCLPEVGLEAKRLPATRYRIEQILILDGDNCHRRRMVHGKWAQSETLPSSAWTR